MFDRSIRSSGALAATIVLVFSTIAQAQQRATSCVASECVTLTGVAYDSLRGAPLVGAFVHLAGSDRTTRSDSTGRFQLDSVPRGPQTLVLYHAWLDSIGLSGVSERVTAGEGRLVRIGIPSFATLWGAACGQAAAPSQGGFIFGSVRSATSGRPESGVSVGVRWNDFTTDGATEFAQQAWTGDVATDSAGDYAVCGVPTDVTLRVVATKGVAATGVIDVASFGSRVLRRDLVIGAQNGSDSIEKGSVVGLVRDRDVHAVANARVATAGVDETRTDADGRFVLRKVPLGTRQLDVTSIGSAPAAAVVNVVRGETVAQPIQLQPVVTLAAVTTRAASSTQRWLSEIAERRRLGYGMVMDSVRVGHLAYLRNAIDLMSDKYMCRIFFIDGRKVVDAAELKFRNPLDIALIERLHDFETPAEMRPKGDCQIFLIWTKTALR